METAMASPEAAIWVHLMVAPRRLSALPEPWEGQGSASCSESL